MLMIMRILVGLANAYSIIIFIYCLLTWIPTETGVVGDVRRIMATLVEPFLTPFRKIIPPIGGMLDISPIIALLVLQLVIRLIYSFV